MAIPAEIVASAKFAIFTRDDVTRVRTQRTNSFDTYALAMAAAKLLYTILDIEEDGEEWAVFYGHLVSENEQASDVYTIELV